MYKIFWIYIVILSFTGSGCLDEIDVKTIDNEQLLTVDAKVFLGVGPHLIRIKKSAPFEGGAKGVEEPISGAIVKIMDIDAKIEQQAKEIEPGVYRNSTLQGIEGHDYKLTIEYDGEIYISQPDKMPKMVPIAKVSTSLASKVINNGTNNLVTVTNITVAIDANLPDKGKEVYLRYRLNGTYKYQEIPSASNLDANICYVNEIIDFDNVNTVEGSKISEGILKAWPIYSKLADYRFAYDYCFKIEQQSISREAYLFWKTIENEYSRTGDIFETPPATLRGNIFNVVETRSDVVGLFSTIANYNTEYHVTSLEAGSPRQQCLGFLRTNPDACFNCLLLQNSTYQKPVCFQ